MKPLKTLLPCLLLVIAGSVSAQTLQTGGKDNRQLLRMGLYPPDILMRHQEELGITADQRKRIASLVREFQGEVTELQWDLPAEQKKLQEILNAEALDQDAALAQAGKVVQMESDFKISHLELLIAIKAELSAEQVEEIQANIKRRLSGKRGS